jgi:hypothetical protein
MPQLYPQPVSSTSGISIALQGALQGGGFVPLNGVGTISLQVTQTSFTSTLGNFTVAHGLGYSPSFAWIVGQTTFPDSGAFYNFQYPTSWDGTNFYLWGSAASFPGFVIAIQ